MSKFEKTWAQPPTPGITERLGDALKPQGALKPRVQTAITRIQKQVSKLDNMLARLNERDARLFERIVAATQRHDAHSSKVLSSELAEIRKVSKVLGNARMALEQIELRLSTCSDLGDTVVTLMPTVGLMKSIKSSLAKFMPGADQEINKMAEMLGGMMTETFSGDATFGIDAGSNEESEKILQEAAAVAASSVDDKFPSIPSETGGKESAESSNRFM